MTRVFPSVMSFAPVILALAAAACSHQSGPPSDASAQSVEKAFSLT